MRWPGRDLGPLLIFTDWACYHWCFPSFYKQSEMSLDWPVSSHEEVMAGDMGRVPVVSSALLTIGACDCSVIGWHPDVLSWWPLICSVCFPRPRKKWKLLFTIYNPTNSCKNNNKKSAAEKKIMSHHAREYRIKIQVLWFRSISWRRWLFPCIINRRYWIDIFRPARWDSIQLFIIHSLTQLHTVACFILRRGSHRDRSCQF